MDDLPFGDREYDILWSEGAIYKIGFEIGVTYWNRYLKPGRLLVASEITWITSSRPLEIQNYWEDQSETTLARIRVGVIVHPPPESS